MLGRVPPHVVNVLPTARVESEMTEPSFSPIVVDGMRTSLQNDVGVPEFPTDPIAPRLELAVAESHQQPLPRGYHCLKIPDPQLHMVQ